MKSISLFPLRRNEYFFGKLLTARDMREEQAYFNRKRRLLNTALYGCGVVCGFGVTRLDGVSAVVEPGLALDGAGRELALSSPAIVRLSELEGFDGDDGRAEHVYLCVRYDETGCEPMHGIADSAVEDSRFNKIEEGCRFYLAYTPPERGAEESGADIALDRLLERGAAERLYLARLEVVRWGEAYEIGAITPLPFGQSIPGGVLRHALGQHLGSEGQEGMPDGASPPPALRAEARAETARYGAAAVELPAKGKTGQVFFSEELPHGLGPGAVCLSLGLATDAGTVFGDGGVFPKCGAYRWAARLRGEDGVFQIGVRLTAPQTEAARLRFVWSARRESPGAELPERPALAVAPALVYLAPRALLQFSYRLCGAEGEAVVWAVTEPEGGRITPEGLYTAPDTPGIYEITAVCPGIPEVRGAAFAVVKEP